MKIRKSTIGIGLCLMVLGIGTAACAPPKNGLPQGPTPIPTLAPIKEITGQLSPAPTQSLTHLSYPARPPSALDGQVIYNTKCAQCHGVDGNGVVPAARNFRDLDYMRGETPASFFSAIAKGRGEMPAFEITLTSDEIWDSVFYVWRLSTDAETLTQGQQIFNENCASCHGEDGSGLVLGSTDFTDPHQIGQLAPRDLYQTITQGRGSMPAWQSSLGQDERWDVIDYLITFTYDPALDEEVVSVVPQTPTEAPAACDPGQENPLEWEDRTAIEAGQVTYEAQCALCHGKDGSGALPNTPDFTSGEVQNNLHESPGRFFCAISEGVGAMPSYGDQLSSESQWQVLTYLGSLLP
ncbi:MAG: c-type cytochrome [Anaerolineales bacterium]|nr:c-type cytochrome [Anaerolineales bacterium]